MAHDILGTDIRLGKIRREWDLSVTAGGDLDTAKGVDNLVQALALRLNIPRGQMAGLGHPDYGSRLHELIGRSNNAATRNLVKFYTLECLRQEPRIESVLDVRVETTPEQGRVDVRVRLLPLEENAPINLIFPFYLET